mmetsp:Transcript_100676/g.189824  ORF Transcript_100676/g.189824 Transcript_100676/m.189824 type:complete len:98 (+) Transcript_100676:70-363(+)
MKAAACVMAVFVLASCGESALVAKGKPATNTECKTLCHRFGMKSLAEQFKDAAKKFTATEGDPVKCCAVCDEVLPSEGGSLAQIRTPLRRLSRKQQL